MNPEVKKHYPKVSFGTIILLFFLPFFVIKCGDTKITSLSGMEMITGKDLSSDFAGLGDLGDDSADSPDKKVKPNFLAILSLLCAVAGLGLAFSKVKQVKMISLAISIVGFLSLIIMYIAARSNLGETGGVIKLVLGIGYYLTVLLFLANSIFFGAGIKEDREAATSGGSGSDDIVDSVFIDD